MIELNLNLPLSPKTKGDILVYLEKRPIGEAYALFQTIIGELTPPKETNGKSNTGHIADSPGSRNTGVSRDCVPAVETEQGSSGPENGT